MKPTLRKEKSSRRSDRKIGRVVFGAFLALGLLAGWGIGNLGARQATRRTLNHAATRRAESARELRLAIGERTRALELLASLPRRELLVAGGALDRFKKLDLELESITIEGEPQTRRSSIQLSANLRDGQRLVATLRKGWATRILNQDLEPTEKRIREVTVILGTQGPVSDVGPFPPSLQALQDLRTRGLPAVRWSDGETYYTVLDAERPPSTTAEELTLVTGVSTKDVAAQASRLRRAGLVLGLLLGIVPGGLAWFGIARSTRRLRATNVKLELRVSQRTEELASAERTFREMFENVPLGLYQCDERGRFLRVNPALAEMFGCANAEVAAEFLGSLDALGHPHERSEFIAKLKTAGRAETMLALPGEHGRCAWLRETARAVYGRDGRLQGFEGVFTDVTEQLALEAQLRQIGATDPLTGLLNRRGFQEAIEKSELPATAIVLDVDRFKEFNDTYGHPAGDRALRTVAEAMRTALRDRGILARTGGEEFAVFVPGASLEAGLEVAEDLRAAVEACALRENMLTVSGGVAKALDLADVSQAFEAADRALYAAKEGGRNRIVASATSLL